MEAMMKNKKSVITKIFDKVLYGSMRLVLMIQEAKKHLNLFKVNIK